jgi:hypothetical protein
VSVNTTEIVQSFFERVRTTRALGAGTPETSYYEALKALIDEVGALLSPQVYCLSQLANTGAGSPDFGLYAANQLQKGEPRPGQPPARGVVEMKAVADDTLFTSSPAQLTKYYAAYRLVIVTNLRSFQIIGEGPGGQAVRLERFSLAPDAASFWTLVQTPAKSAKSVGTAFGEFLRRALTQTVALHQPEDVAWFLASYARDALARVEMVGNLPALQTVRSALEDALGIAFEAKKGDHFFRSTLVQTLFYGLFSAWILWARTNPKSSPKFDWKAAHWHLDVPFVRTLFQQLASPTQLGPLGLTEVLDWTGETLNRISPTEFLAGFDAGEAVQYFYEPFLEAFDPELRKQFGVWYTPSDIVSYMVARVDQALKDELGITDGLAAENVYVLDPCCGTGGFLTAVLKRIHANLAGHGLGDTLSDKVREIARTRVFGFEIMPAPFVVAHLQVGLALTGLKAPLAEGERPGIYLTNALTGWEPHTNKPLPFPELEEERAFADAIKQAKPILVILGNPPYNGFAGVATGPEERSLSTAYRAVKKVEPPQGKGLNEVYVRFFRMAERRIAEKTGAGVISFISNYSWLDGLSYTGMRERYLDVFDSISIDNLHGDRKASERAPDGKSSATVFAVRGHSPGIRVGTAIATLVRKKAHTAQTQIAYRDFHQSNADDRRVALLASVSDKASDYPYELITPLLPLKLSFKKGDVGAGYINWPKLTELLQVSFPGIQTSRDEFLVSIDRPELEKRVTQYFDPNISDEDVRKSYPIAMAGTKRFKPSETRAALLKRGILKENFVHYAYRPFDLRWLYWDPITKFLDEKREEYWPHVRPGNLTIAAQQKPRGEWQSSQVIQSIACLDLIDRGASNFPREVFDAISGGFRPNISGSLLAWLSERGLTTAELFAHLVATLHAPSYATTNAGALRIDWPRIPLPKSSALFKASADLGAAVSSLLDVESAVPGVSVGPLLPGLSAVGTPHGNDYRITAGWGHSQIGRTGSAIVMPGNGDFVARDWTPLELESLKKLGERHSLELPETLAALGETCLDIRLNDTTCWRGVPSRVWAFTLGGYPVLKKWLSYREFDVLGRVLHADEVRYFASVVRRISEILAMGPGLDAAHSSMRSDAIAWGEGKPLPDAS